MGDQILRNRRVWALAATQHWVVTRTQLLALGVTPKAIKYAVGDRRLHPVLRGVYALGRADLCREGRWLAAVLSCGPDAVLSHGSAAALLEIGEYERGQVEVSVPAHVARRRPGIRVHRTSTLRSTDVTCHRGVLVTSAIRTLVDLTPRLSRRQREAAINEADKLDLVSPVELRAALEERAGERGVAGLRDTLDRHTYCLTDSELERMFLPLARRAGLPPPRTRVRLNGFVVDFFWPDLGLVVETDGLRYHRTPAAQARDRRRDQAHSAAGLTPLRFTHDQVKYERGHVEAVLRDVAARLAPPDC